MISDFDYTLSRHKDQNNDKCLSTHGVFDAVARVMNSGLKQIVRRTLGAFDLMPFSSMTCTRSTSPSNSVL